MDVVKILTFCLERLVDNPRAIEIKKTTLPEKTIYEIKVDPADRARVIGKEGKTFKALRALINLPVENTQNDLVIETS
jgi:predicted RNA-binding protein YlqC (UPF0109 family)